MSDKFFNILDRFSGKRIAIIGDLMLDAYIWGSVNRFSPEAPVPVVDVEKENIQLGGAANVASNIKSLGGVPIIFGVVGDDEKGKTLLNLLKDSGVLTDGIVVEKSRPTTVKTRVIAHNQHVVRIDNEKEIQLQKLLKMKL